MTAKTLSLFGRLQAASAEAQKILAGTDTLMEHRGALIDERLRLLRGDLHEHLSDWAQRRG